MALLCALIFVLALAINPVWTVEAGMSFRDPGSPGVVATSAERFLNDLSRIAEVLTATDCATPEDAERFLAAVRSSARDPREAAIELATVERGICRAGLDVIVAVAQSPSSPFFEHLRLVYDADADGCAESAYEAATVARYDEDADGCLDRIWEFAAVVERLGLPPPVSIDLRRGVESVIDHMLPVPGVRPGLDPTIRRQQAEPLLDELIDLVEQSEMPVDQRAFLTSYLENTRPFVQGYVGCGFQDGTPAGTTTTSGDTTFRFYIEAQQSHAAKALERNGERYGRGLWKKGYKSAPGQKAPESVPASDEPGEGDGAVGEGSASSSSSGKSSSGSSSDSSSGTSPFGDGEIRQEAPIGGSSYRICWEITAEEWDKIAGHMNADVKDPPVYNFFDFGEGTNCLGWAISNAELIGKSVPDHTYWGVPDPATLRATLERMHKNGETLEGATIEPANP